MVFCQLSITFIIPGSDGNALARMEGYRKRLRTVIWKDRFGGGNRNGCVVLGCHNIYGRIGLTIFIVTISIIILKRNNEFFPKCIRTFQGKNIWIKVRSNFKVSSSKVGGGDSDTTVVNGMRVKFIVGILNPHFFYYISHFNAYCFISSNIQHNRFKVLFIGTGIRIGTCRHVYFNGVILIHVRKTEKKLTSVVIMTFGITRMRIPSMLL